MKKASWVLGGLLSLGLLGLPAYVQAGSSGNGAVQRAAAARQEKDLNFTDLPKAAQDAVIAASGGSKVRHVTQYIDTVNGKTHYHVVAGNGIVRQVFVLDDAGNLLFTKEKVAFESLSDPVKQAMSAQSTTSEPVDNVEKAGDAKDPAKTYYIGNVLVAAGRLPDKLIRVGEDGKVVTGIPADDIQLANEKVVPQLFRVSRPNIKFEAVNLDDLPGPVKATIAADAKGDPIDNVLHLLPAGTVPAIYVATLNKGMVHQRKIFVDGNGDMLDCVAELRPYLIRRSTF